MANEAVLVLRQEDPIDFIVNDSSGIEKGSVQALITPRTVKPTSDTAQVCAGIARREKIASDGRTRLGFFRKGIFRMVPVPQAISVGSQVVISGTNLIRTALTDGTEDHAVIGRALETSPVETSTAIQVAVNM